MVHFHLLFPFPPAGADTLCIRVDPDALARLLPERSQYLAANPRSASTLLHPEASLLQEVVSGVAKTQKRSLVVDGSLTDCGWYKGIMRCVLRGASACFLGKEMDS